MGAISLRPLLWSLDRSPAPLLRAWAPPAGEAGEASLPLLLLIDRRDAAGARAAPALRGLLGARELERLARFRQAADRERFLLGRGGLRWLLGTLLDCPAAELPLTEGSHGKPELRGGPQFNISHSGDLVLLAVHRQLPDWRGCGTTAPGSGLGGDCPAGAARQGAADAAAAAPPTASGGLFAGLVPAGGQAQGPRRWI
jgi:hypothetical protein